MVNAYTDSQNKLKISAKIKNSNYRAHLKLLTYFI